MDGTPSVGNCCACVLACTYMYLTSAPHIFLLCFFLFFDWFGMRGRTPRATHSKISALLKLALACQVGLTKHLLVCLHTTGHLVGGLLTGGALHTPAGCSAPAAGG